MVFIKEYGRNFFQNFFKHFVGFLFSSLTTKSLVVYIYIYNKFSIKTDNVIVCLKALCICNQNYIIFIIFIQLLVYFGKFSD